MTMVPTGQNAWATPTLCADTYCTELIAEARPPEAQIENAVTSSAKSDEATCHPIAVVPKAMVPVLSEIGWVWRSFTSLETPADSVSTKPPPPITGIRGGQNARATPVCCETL